MFTEFLGVRPLNIFCKKNPVFNDVFSPSYSIKNYSFIVSNCKNVGQHIFLSPRNFRSFPRIPKIILSVCLSSSGNFSLLGFTKSRVMSSFTISSFLFAFFSSYHFFLIFILTYSKVVAFYVFFEKPGFQNVDSLLVL